jgi:hypothetical protein
MKGKRWASAAVGAFVLALAGCGGNGGGSASDSSSLSPEADSTSASWWCNDESWLASATNVYAQVYGAGGSSSQEKIGQDSQYGGKLRDAAQSAITAGQLPTDLDFGEATGWWENLGNVARSGMSYQVYSQDVVSTCIAG